MFGTRCTLAQKLATPFIVKHFSDDFVGILPKILLHFLWRIVDLNILTMIYIVTQLFCVFVGDCIAFCIISNDFLIRLFDETYHEIFTNIIYQSSLNFVIDK